MSQIRRGGRLRFARQISPHHPIVSARPYKVYLSSPPEVWRRIKYANDNPIKEGLAAQHWDFVKPYDNWPHHKNRK